MGAVLDFKPREEPHLAGEAVCVSCRHTWVAVAPVGTWQLECPSCETWHGVWRYPIGASEGDAVFVCECGCEALTAYVHHGLYRHRCMKCGVDHTEALFA
jgi:hypothetical protein